MADQPVVHIRWMLKRDMPEVMAIENASFAQPWTEAEFLGNLRARNCIGMVAETGGPGNEQILGFMAYELFRGRLNVINFAVHPRHRRQGVGRKMVAKLIGKLSAGRRDRITLMVNEQSLDGCLFFRQQGFLATEVIRTPWDHSTNDGYVFEYDLDAAPGLGIKTGATVA